MRHMRGSKAAAAWPHLHTTKHPAHQLLQLQQLLLPLVVVLSVPTPLHLKHTKGAPQLCTLLLPTATNQQHSHMYTHTHPHQQGCLPGSSVQSVTVHPNAHPAARVTPATHPPG